MAEQELVSLLMWIALAPALGLAIKFAGDIGINAVALTTLTLWCVFLLALRLTLVMFGQ